MIIQILEFSANAIHLYRTSCSDHASEPGSDRPGLAELLISAPFFLELLSLHDFTGTINQSINFIVCLGTYAQIHQTITCSQLSGKRPTLGTLARNVRPSQGGCG